MDDFKNFYNNKKKVEPPKQKLDEKVDLNKVPKEQLDYINDLAGYYNKEGEQKLIDDIYKNVADQKKQGKLSNAEIKSMANRFSPMLNSEQRAKLNELVAQLTKD